MVWGIAVLRKQFNVYVVAGGRYTFSERRIPLVFTRLQPLSPPPKRLDQDEEACLSTTVVLY
jgi:hypothetical protein